jgi:3-hydroxybutyryl-CoA dehydrogenase
MVASVAKGLSKQVEKGRLTEDDKAAILGRITAVSELSALADCDLVIESVVEDLNTKKSLFTELDRIVKPTAIIATNTSTLSVIDLAMCTSRPELVCGIHFFNPATAMPLVEIVRPLSASDATIETATAFATTCGKQPVQVKDRAGFIVNALLIPYILSAVRMLESGYASAEDIDLGMVEGCAHPMGPLRLADLIGLDTTSAVAESLYTEFKEPLYAAPPLLSRMVDAGLLGRKAGRGFYDYSKK